MREEIEARPAVTLVAGLILGLVVISFPLAILGLVGLAVWLQPIRAKCLVAAAFVVGLGLSPQRPVPLRAEIAVRGTGTVASVPNLLPDAQICEFEIGGRSLLLSMPRSPGVMLGDRLSIDGIAKPPHATPGSRKFETIQGRMSVDGFVVVTQGSWIAHLADEWRRSFMAYVDRNLNEKAASLVDAICFNARSGVDPQTRQEMASSGTVHILSASGLQVFVFGFLVAMVLRFFPLHRSVQILALALVLVVYSIGAGLQPQIVRAACMTVLGLAAYMAKRDPDALSALALSGIAYLLWRPDSVYGMAFQVSFVTVACISLFYRRSSATRVTLRAEIVRYTKEFLSLSGIVVLASAPLIAYYLGVISMVSVFANLLVCWSLPLIVAVAFFGHGVSLLAPAVGDSIASHFLGPLCDWIYRVLDGMGRGFGTLDVPSFSGVWLLAFYGAWLMTYRRRVVQP